MSRPDLGPAMVRSRRHAGAVGCVTAVLVAATLVVAALVGFHDVELRDAGARGPVEVAATRVLTIAAPLHAPSAHPRPSAGHGRSLSRVVAVVDEDPTASSDDADPLVPLRLLRDVGPGPDAVRRQHAHDLRSLAANRAADVAPSELLRWRPQRLEGP